MTHSRPLPSDPRQFIQVPVSKLRIDQRNQRGLDDTRIAAMADDWQWLLAEVITVTPAQRGTYLVIEGQNRTEAIRRRDPDALVWVAVVKTDHEVERPQVARGIYTGRRGHNAVQRWEVDLASGDEHIVAANAVLANHGLRIAMHGSPETVAAASTVASLVRNNRRSAEEGALLLDRVLSILEAAFPFPDRETQTYRFERSFLHMIARLVVVNDGIDTKRLAQVIRARPMEQWLIDLNGPRYDRMTRAQHVAQIVIRDYNKGKRKDEIGW